MPTIDDLRTALTSLESEAPDVETLLMSPAQRHDRIAGGTLERRLPASAVLLIAVVALVVFAAWNAGSSPSNRAGSNSPNGSGAPQNVLLPFRLTSALEPAQLADASSFTGGENPTGAAVLTEYGMEVTIHVDTNVGAQVYLSAATPVQVDGVTGWIDTECGLRPAISSARPTAGPSATPSEFNPQCSLFFVSGPWRVLIYVAGPGGGTRDITNEQFEDIGARLQLAASTDPATWFRSGDLLPR